MISTKGRYALRLMIDLSVHNSENYVPLKDISMRQGISEKYMEIIIKALVNNRLIKGLRGKGGGYKLTRNPSEYTVGEILEAAGEQLAPVACLLPNAEPCGRKNNCPTIAMWEKYNAITHDYFYGITLADLAGNQGLP
ncbi:MAG: Rrf2 family transcriptional regulator [Clostridium sp.]|nr:Rrf2 family transcriptional regulator [Clostridium sp.]MCM1398349.1 Rrf2 family transcriptional regulator [Clostridium sp.]MCM1458986.1 Rrf2 family transcriptional regulator [Bacteroides sp.]